MSQDMKLAVFASLAILLGTGLAFAADTDAGTAGRPGAVLSDADCMAAWHGIAGDELMRFHRTHDGLLPVNARGVVTNFQQADTDEDGKVSLAEFREACKLGLVAASDVDRTASSHSLY
jgi:hypothetical protein